MNPLTPETARTAGVAARIAALGATVVLFATMWESDGKPEESEHWLVQRAARQQETVADHDDRNETVETATVQTQPVSASQPLPQHITPGQYIVADSRGQVQHIRVTAEMASSTPNERSHYTLEQNSVTLYFIRVEEDDRVADAAAGEQENQ